MRFRCQEEGCVEERQASAENKKKRWEVRPGADPIWGASSPLSRICPLCARRALQMRDHEREGPSGKTAACVGQKLSALPRLRARSICGAGAINPPRCWNPWLLNTGRTHLCWLRAVCVELMKMKNKSAGLRVGGPVKFSNVSGTLIFQF